MHDRIFLACTPRTGNLWIRGMVGRALSLPTFAAHNPGELDWSGLPDRCLVAMHWRHSPAFERFLREEGFRIVVTARHPLDVLVSILHFAPTQPTTARWLEGECGNERSLTGVTPDSDAFSTYCLSPRAEALLSVSMDWQQTAEATARYEDVLASPRAAIASLLQALGAAARVDLDDVITSSTLDHTRSTAIGHAWRGRSGEWRRLITAEQARRVYDRHQAVFDAFGYEADADPDLDASGSRRHWMQMVAAEPATAPPAPGRTADAHPEPEASEPQDLDHLRREVEAVRWFHRIDLGRGLITPGVDIDGQAKIAFTHIPEDLTGKTVLDVGAWDGLFSFEAEKRGAARVLATDSFAWSNAGWGSKAGFELARRTLKSRVEDMTIDVMDVTPDRVGVFDVVFFLGILYHLRHPFLALEKVAAVTRERLIVSTWVDLVHVDRPAAAFYPKSELGGDVTNWWGFNPPCVTAMLTDLGFRRVEVVSSLQDPGQPDASAFPMAFHAWK